MGFTQDFIAKELKVSRQAISNWEKESRNIDVDELLKYAKILEISFEDLEKNLNQSINPSADYTNIDDPKKISTHLFRAIKATPVNDKIRRNVKIEGDKVVGVHALLSSLFLNQNTLTLNNCPTAFDFLNVLYLFANNGWVDAHVSKDAITLTAGTAPFNITLLNKVSRASIGVISALTYKYHQLLFSFPGGNDFCDRPIDLHLEILATISNYQYDASANTFYAEKKDTLNRNLVLNCYADGSKSVGAFFNALSLAYVYPNALKINGLSQDPTILFLIAMLEKSTNRVVIHPAADKILIPAVDALVARDCQVTLPPDMTMLVSYVLLLWDRLETITFSNVKICEIPQNYAELFENLGLALAESDHTLVFHKVAKINEEYFEFLRLGSPPQITTDLGPIISEFLAFRNIPSILLDEVFGNRSSHISELQRLGINIKCLRNGALKTQARSKQAANQNDVFDLQDIRAGMAITMGLVHRQIPAALLLNYDQLLRGFGNIQSALSLSGYEGEIYG
ncbi:helix-turn-helix domain-containing protein [Lapidilactobacillus luobeiensis]|uniref:helix-turn-helix domain-containing protein n=1 Tax=Lapidilactobacillus luobeiensis TaxID=2950371 RepID=UPI0021C3E098|nr:helix-turn-helix domain-containing protein [Lapidilactobacillus luobeiensis]